MEEIKVTIVKPGLSLNLTVKEERDLDLAVEYLKKVAGFDKDNCIPPNEHIENPN